MAVLTVYAVEMRELGSYGGAYVLLGYELRQKPENAVAAAFTKARRYGYRRGPSYRRALAMLQRGETPRWSKDNDPELECFAVVAMRVS